MANTMELAMILKAQNTATKQIQGLQKEIKAVENQIKQTTKVNKAELSSFSQDIKKVGGVIAGAFAINKIKDFTLESVSAFEGFEQASNAMAEQFDVNKDEILATLKEVSGGTVANSDLVLAANRAMALNVTNDVGEMSQLLEFARLRARAMGLDTTQAFNDIVTGIGRGSPLILDNLGIITKGWDEEAKAADKAFDSQFILNKVLQQSADLTEKMGDVQLTNKEKALKFRAEMEDLKVEIGSKLLPVIQNLQKWFSEKIVPAIQWATQNTDKLKAGAEALAVAFIGIKAIKMVEWFSGITQSMIASATQIVATQGKVGLLNTSLRGLPLSLSIGVMLVGAKLVFDQIQALKHAMNQAQESQQAFADISRERAEKNLKVNEKIREQNEELSKSGSAIAKKTIEENNQLIKVNNERVQAALKAEKLALKEKQEMNITGWTSNQVAQKKQLKSEIELLKQEVAAHESSAKQITRGLEKEVASRGAAMQRSLNESAAIFEKKAKKGGVSERGGKGGGGESEAVKEAKKQAEELAKLQEDLGKRVGESRQAWRDMVAGAEESLTELREAHNTRIDEIEEAIKGLENSLEGLTNKYNDTIAGLDLSAAEEVIRQQEKIKELQDEINEARESGESTSDLESQLAREKSALQAFLSERTDLEDELTEVKRRNSLTDFERFVEDQNKKRDTLASDFEKEKGIIQSQIDEQARLKDETIKAFQEKETQYIQTLDVFNKFKDGVIDGFGQIETKTETSVKILESRLSKLRSLLEEIQNVSGTSLTTGSQRVLGGSLNTENAQSIFGAAPPNTNSVSNSSSTNVTINVSGTDGMNEDTLAKKISSEFQKLSRSMELKTMGVPSTT